MKISGNAVRPGNVIELEGRLWTVLKTQHTQPGKGGAYLQAEMKDVRNGTKRNERFRSSESVERVHLDERTFQYLYQDGDMCVFMDQNTYEQMSLSQDLLGDRVCYLQPDVVVTLCFYEEQVLSVVFPPKMVFEVVEAEPVVKGQTASSSYKPARLDNGLRVMVPPHIEIGTRVVVQTEDGTYVERAKEGAS